ncbi:hypothetical protein SCB49_10442 [unidentified eubacterium SCB49]|nr:hypothetical protein SCB49_10442 [unidentified eubacterium SCB49]
MEVIIVLIITGTVGYLIYQSLPNTKYEKAKNLFKAKDYLGAITILNEIFEKHPDAPTKLAECKLNLGQQASGKVEKIKYFNEVTGLRKKISNSASFSKFDNIEAKAIFEISKIQYEEAKGNIEKLNKNICFIDTANQKGSEFNFRSLKTKHFSDLADCHFKLAIEKEKTGRQVEITEAIQYYTTAKSLVNKTKTRKLSYNSSTRVLICQLKLNQNVNLVSSSEIKKSDKHYQKELYFRYAIQLLNNRAFSDAEKIVSKHLNFQSPEIDKLKEILRTQKVNNAVKTVSEINNSIDKLYNNSLATEELKLFYDSLDDVSNELSDVESELSEQMTAFKPTLFNRLLTQYIETELYDKAINIIYKYPKFWESSELLKNLGICCYGATSKGLMTESNYKVVVSGWLTSVFSDKVILKSLDDTTWDDNYTFSLAEAIGSNYLNYEEIPDNVNYDEVSELNISIGATQKELLQQFETIIHKEIQDTKLSKLVNDFYDIEKDAIEKIIKQIENDVFLATPYFAISNGLNNEIISELDNDYHTYSNEDALEAGLPYVKNSTSTMVYKYLFANNLIKKLKSAIGNENLSTIKKLNTKKNKKWIEKFDSISSSVEDNLFNSVTNKISEDDENEKLISIMEECISFSHQNEKLKHQYSNYVANYCISQINENNIANFKGLSLMKGAYLRSPNNPRIVKNFITLIRFNLMDMLNDQTRNSKGIYNILDWVKNNMSQTYKQNSDELSKARREILQQLKQSGVDTSLFDDNSLSSLISGNSLNSQGLKMKKVLGYFRDLGNEDASYDPLDVLSRLRKQLNLDDENLPF